MITNNFFDDFFDFGIVPNKVPRFPEYHFTNEDNKLEVNLVLPGFEKDEISIEAKDGILIVKGEFEEKNKAKVRYKSFEKRFKTKDIDEDNISATLKNGILTLALKEKETRELETKRILIN